MGEEFDASQKVKHEAKIIVIIGNRPTTASQAPRKPKKRGPFQLVPVILRAMVDRLAKTCPCQQKPPGTTRTSCSLP